LKQRNLLFFLLGATLLLTCQIIHPRHIDLDALEQFLEERLDGYGPWASDASLMPLLWLSGKGGIWLLLPAGVSLAIFVWLLTLPSGSEWARVCNIWGYLHCNRITLVMGSRCYQA
jgi:hypothetical protein